ncbi:MAG TPA: hypothetical protein VFE47_31760 [Tepidisphaeraceae bacterium]|jgi:hypothetical protein|nr:hypothetical protein [Tepidisphaeraceae bacterium]
MRADAYSKIVLTVIAIALSTLAIEQVSLPRAAATPPAADNPKFPNITYQYGSNSISFFDKSTGDLWYYGAYGSEEKPQHEKLTQLGVPLEK